MENIYTNEFLRGLCLNDSQEAFRGLYVHYYPRLKLFLDLFLKTDRWSDDIIADRQPDDVITYAISTAVPGRPSREGTDSEGNVFRKLGFTEESRRTFPSRIKGEEGRISVSVSVSAITS